MNYFSFLKSLDNTLGGAICLFFSLLRRKNTSTDIPPCPKILIIKFWGMGSLLLSAPAVRAVKEHFHPSELIVLTLSQNRDICAALGLYSEILTCRLRPLPVFMFDLFRAILTLRRKGIDLLFDFEFFTHFSALTTFFINARRNVGFYATEVERGDFYEVTAPFNSYWHISRIYMNMVGKVVPGTPDEAPVVPVFEAGAAERFGLDAGRYVVVNPNSDPIAPQRRWPAEYFADLMSRIQQAGFPVVMIGGNGEVAYNESIRLKTAHPERVMNLAGKTDISELSAILKAARMVVTNDSGPLHLAVVLGTPTVSFFGPETPVIYGPQDREKHMVFFDHIECSPCMNIRKAKEIKCAKGKADCLLQITPDRVWQAVSSRLGAKL